MVLDPTVDVIRMSATSAATLGIKLDVAAAPAEITLADGRKLAARQAVLKIVQVGDFKAEQVECLVIPEGFETPPVLGASFLNRFAYRFDPDAEKITLTRVDLKPLPKLVAGLA